MKRIRKDWLPEEELFLIKNYKTMQIKKIAEHLDRTKTSVDGRLSKLQSEGRIMRKKYNYPTPKVRINDYAVKFEAPEKPEKVIKETIQIVPQFVIHSVIALSTAIVILALALFMTVTWLR